MQHSASATATPPSATSWRRPQGARADALAHGGVQRPQRPEVRGRQRALERVAAQLGQLGADLGGRPRSAEQRDRVALDREPEPPGPRRVGQLADHADHRRRVDRALAALVVQGHVAAHHRDRERPAGVAQPGHRARELPCDVGLLRVAEVQAVGEPERLGADAGEVGRALEHRLDRAVVRVDRHAAAVAVDRHRDRAAGLEHQHGGVGLLGAAHGARADHAVVLLERPPARRQVGAAEQGEQRAGRVEPLVELALGRRVDRRRRLERLEVVGRALVDQGAHRQVADQRLAVEHAQPPGAGHLADRGGVDLPPAAHRQHVVELRRLDHAQHPLLRLRDHDLERLHVGLAERHPPHVEVDADAALRRHLRRRRGQPRRAQVLQGDQQPGVEQLERALEQPALLERVADLDRRALGAVLVAELGGGEHGGAADPVAPRARAEQHDHVPDARGGAPDQLAGLDQADAHRVDEAVLLVRALEVDLAADGGDADRVPVVADAGDGVLEQVAGARGVGDLAEPQRVEDRDRPRADREHVAQDAADAGRRSLERLDRARVVVRLDLERAREPVPEVDRPRVLARAEHEPAALGRQRLEQPARVLVAAVLGPHQAEDRELDLVRLAPQLVDDQLVLGVGEPELAMAGGDHAGAPISASPSTEPVRRSTACSGCGIRPSTLPASLHTPAMSCAEPLKLWPGA